MNELQFCNNCGKKGHLFHKCKIPITSFGIITYRFYEGKTQYLMIRRKHTLGYIDFIRGKYSALNYDYLLNMFKQMTTEEKGKIVAHSFETLWREIWGEDMNLSLQYKNEQYISRDKFNLLKAGIFLHKGRSFTNNSYNLERLVADSSQFDTWEEPEWGFPKGRRNYQETDYDCAIREFHEETGIHPSLLKQVVNLYPFEETFTGSNYKSYKHKYFLTYLPPPTNGNMEGYEKSEVSKMEWKTYEDCMRDIRPYNLEKKRLITTIHTIIQTYSV